MNLRGLVLSGGGMFGAYQAGAWRALRKQFSPDLLVGSSIGAVNAFAIASGMPPDELAGWWMGNEMESMATLKLSMNEPGGLCSPARLEDGLRRLVRCCRPKKLLGIVMVELPSLIPRLICSRTVTVRHLLASCAVPFLFPPVRIGGSIMCDGSYMQSPPYWVAQKMGASRIASVELMPNRGAQPEEVTAFRPHGSLGGLREMLVWNRERVTAALERGESETAAALATTV